IDTDGKMHGQLSFGAPPQQDMPDTPDTQDSQDTPDIPDPKMTEDWTRSDLPDTSAKQQGIDYMYSRAELNRQIKEQETQIKQLEISLKSAELKLAAAQKQKKDGRVLAELDGVVKKIGTVNDGMVSENQSDSPDDPFAQPSEDDQYFAVIEGEGGMEVICQVVEMNLDKVQPGAVLEINSYSDGAFSEAVVTSIDPEPVSYGYQGWGVNPNNSTYKVHAKIENSDEFMIGVGVSATVSGMGDQQQSDSIYIPAHYVHKEGGDYYVMKADDNDRLVKQYIRVGSTEYYVEVTGGLSMKDRICFPYGTNVKEGVKTNDTSEPVMPENMYY
ncbi:MAG: secretion protein HlyD, partial [Oscillospiraceae bacterium]|nr:secretion protein HlyD [Oscillospiraceae bacterium]